MRIFPLFNMARGSNLAAARAAVAKKRKKQAGKITGGRNYITKQVQAKKAEISAAEHQYTSTYTYSCRGRR